MFTLEALEAKHGDSLLLHWGDGGARHLIVIDGGPAGVFRASLRPRLQALAAERGGGPLPIRLLMVSHIDDDHVRGVLDLTRELSDLKKERKPLPWRVMGLWHNSFDDVIGNAAPLAAALEAAVRPVSLGGDLPAGLPFDRPSAAIVASVAQGRELRNDARALGLDVNTPWGKLVWAPADGQRTVKLDDGLTIRVVGPLEAQVRELQKDWDKKLEEMKKKGTAEAQAIAAEFVDKSVYNLSSIVVLAERGRRRMLLTGDARGDFVLDGLAGAGLLDDDALHVDLLKLPHHGSDRNVAPEFFRRVTADHYVISADGRHGNPEPATLEMLTEARGNAAYRIHLTNRDARSVKFLARDQAKAGRRYEVVFREDDARGVSVPLDA
jgi:hypothetical protein